MFRINKEKFNSSLEKFRAIVFAEQKENYHSEALSFSEGFLRDQEWYKHEIFEKAQSILDVQSWSPDDIGTGKILERVKEVLLIKVGSQRQNIIFWMNVEQIIDTLDKHPKESEAILFNLYCGDSDKNAFDSATELLGQRYDVISYLFYVKDCNNYVPVKPMLFKKRLDLLGITTNSLEKCTWDNYQDFLDIVRWVKDAISPYFSAVSMLDAHSFIWMMWLVDKEDTILIGSPKWFFEKSQTERMYEINEMIENRRAAFLESFSPEQLSLMNGEELLNKVFSDSSGSMMRLLMFDDDYRWFGAAGKYKYLGIVYQGNGTTWVYKKGNHSQTVTRAEAEKKAETVRNDIVSCVDEIENIGVFQTIQDYNTLLKKIKTVFFFQYPWMMKYYQMLYPQYFPGMYAEKTLSRALHILGLPNHGVSERLLNAGEISLFIRKCDVNNILFNQIYDDEWGWEQEVPPCQAAKLNYTNRNNPIHSVVTKYYKTPTSTEARKNKRTKQAIEIETEISSHNLEGKEKQAVVKVRVNQSEFRSRILSKYKKCCLCGVSNPALLVASHIKPWSVSEPEERLDDSNGFLLCPNHDKLFDSGLISFEDTGRIIISPELSEIDRIFMNVNIDMKVSASRKQIEYLSYHRDKVFKR